MECNKQIIVQVANVTHSHYALQICEEMEASANARGTGIAKRSPSYLIQKMEEGKAVIAYTSEGKWAGFCYIETWSHGKYVANSGLVVAPEFRKSGLARKIKERILELSTKNYPGAKIFGLTTGLAVMKINSDLGYKPVTYSELTDDESFWEGCRSCVNFEILNLKERKNCLCTAMLYEPDKTKKNNVNPGKSRVELDAKLKIYERWMKLKQMVLLKGKKKEEPPDQGVKKEKKVLANFFNTFFG